MTTTPITRKASVVSINKKKKYLAKTSKKANEKIYGILIVFLILSTVFGIVYANNLIFEKNKINDELIDTKKSLKITKNNFEEKYEELNNTKEELDNTKKSLKITKNNFEEKYEELNNTKEEYQKYKETYILPKAREFNSINELKDWLKNNDVSENIYKKDIYDCDDFALDLVEDARNEGYLLYAMGKGNFKTRSICVYDGVRENFRPPSFRVLYHYETVIDYQSYEEHAYNVAKINGLWYNIEPQTDEIEVFGSEL